MRIGPIGESFTERVALAFRLAPIPLVETQVAYTLARVLMAGCMLGVFDALGEGATDAAAVARACATDPTATEHLLRALAQTSYVRRRGGEYTLTADGRKWLTSGGSASIKDKLVIQYREWELLTRLDDYLRTGKALDLHEAILESADDWRQYQAAMRALAAGAADEVGKRTPVPADAAEMLDIGGSHGLYSLAICRRHPGLRSTVLELPPAVEAAAAIAAAAGAGDLVRYRGGNALTDDLGEDCFDLVTIFNVVHHFTAEQNADLARRVKRALRPGGLYVIGDFLRQAPDQVVGGQVGALMDLYFAFTSTSGTWTLEEMRGWLSEAGLSALKRIVLRTLPNFALVVGRA